MIFTFFPRADAEKSHNFEQTPAGAPLAARGGLLAAAVFGTNYRYKEATPPQYLGGTKAVCRLGHEIALDMAIS